MKFGCCTTMEHYELLTRLGYDWIELSGAEVHRMTAAALEQTVRRIKTGRVKCCGFNASLIPEVMITGPNYNKEVTRKYASLLCERGAKLGISAIGIGSPRSRELPKGFSYKTAMEQAQEFLAVFAREAAIYGIVINWEALNHLESDFGISMREGVDLVRSLECKNVGVVGDLYHMSIQEEGLAELEYALPVLGHLHLSELENGMRCYPSLEHLERYRALILPLIKHGYIGGLSVEAMDGDVQTGITRTLEVFKMITHGD